VPGCWAEDYRSRAREWSSKVSIFLRLYNKYLSGGHNHETEKTFS
jgi:hypothetical protein